MGVQCEIGDFFYRTRETINGQYDYVYYCEPDTLCPENEQLTKNCSCKGYSNCTSGEFCLEDGTCVSQEIPLYPSCYREEPSYELTGDLVPILSLGKDCDTPISSSSECDDAVSTLSAYYYPNRTTLNELTVLSAFNYLVFSSSDSGQAGFPKGQCFSGIMIILDLMEIKEMQIRVPIIG